MKKGKDLLGFLLIITVVVVIGYFIGFQLTGKASQNVGLNISVGGPQITSVFNSSQVITGLGNNGPNEAPAITDVIINFTAYSTAGAINLNDSTALINITYDSTRENASCARYEVGTNYANYTCNISLWWWDGSGTWNITAFIKDNQTNVATNITADFYLGQRTAFVMGPSTLGWPGIAPGATNQTSNTDPLVLNNTGNDIIIDGNISVNSSNLRGETTSAEALWAENFSVDWQTGGAACSGDACLECAGTQMSRSVYANITTANLTKGNYTINNGYTGQEQLYFCLKHTGTELSTQAYSTANETEWQWKVQIG